MADKKKDDEASAALDEASAALDELAQLRAENEKLRAALDAAKPSAAVKHVPAWKRHAARATARGVAHNRIYEPGEELTIVVDATLKPPSWLELLDEGTPCDGPDSLVNASDFAKAESPRVQSGFAAGL